MVMIKGMVVAMGKVGHTVVALGGRWWPRGWWAPWRWWGPWGRLATGLWP